MKQTVDSVFKTAYNDCISEISQMEALKCQRAIQNRNGNISESD